MEESKERIESFFSRNTLIPALSILGFAVILTILYFALSTRNARNNLTQELREEVSQKGIMMEDYLQPEIALAKKLASAPTVVSFFKNPSDKQNRALAMREFKSFQDAFSSRMVFWTNDIDKEFWSNMKYSYTVDPENPDDYWYKLTLYETDVYNFNINYNAEMGMTCLWLNGVVRDENKKPIGMTGTGIELDNFIAKCYETLGDEINLYFFNSAKEVTGAIEKSLLINKTHIDTIYTHTNNFEELMTKAKNLAQNGGQYSFTIDNNELGVIRYLPSYGWYMIASAHIRDVRHKSNSHILIIALVTQIILSAFVIFIAKLKNVMIRARSASGKLIEETQNLAVSSKQNAATAQDQSTAVKEIVSTMEDNTTLSEEISQKIKDVSGVAAKTNSDVTEGVGFIEENVRQLQEIADTNLNTINGIKELGDKIENIWDIVTLINSVADQAKIIAFNAELEASSAGEAGKNFHIVATEIRRLADGIIDGTKEIKGKISEIQESSDALILASETGTEKIQAGVENAKNLEARFGSIKGASEITAESAEKITTIIHQQAVASEQILVTLKQISSGVENFTSATNHISKSSQKLQLIAEELSK